MAANIQFQVGDQCQVRVPGGDFSGEVTALNVSSGCHLVGDPQCLIESDGT